jgi:hypothetical protein
VFHKNQHSAAKYANAALRPGAENCGPTTDNCFSTTKSPAGPPAATKTFSRRDAGAQRAENHNHLFYPASLRETSFFQNAELAVEGEIAVVVVGIGRARDESVLVKKAIPVASRSFSERGNAERQLRRESLAASPIQRTKPDPYPSPLVEKAMSADLRSLLMTGNAERSLVPSPHQQGGVHTGPRTDLLKEGGRQLPIYVIRFVVIDTHTRLLRPRKPDRR